MPASASTSFLGKGDTLSPLPWYAPGVAFGIAAVISPARIFARTASSAARFCTSWPARSVARSADAQSSAKLARRWRDLAS